MLKSIMMPQILRHRKHPKTHCGAKIALMENLEILVSTCSCIGVKEELKLLKKGLYNQ